MNKEKTYSLVLGGYVNGYSIIKELYDKDIRNIALFDYSKQCLARFSNKITYFKIINKDSKSLIKAILQLKSKCDYIIIYPTDDLQLELLNTIYNEIYSFCFLPFNQNNISKTLDKIVQYSFCEKYDIPYPITQLIEKKDDINNIKDMIFPVIVKPNKRNDITTDVFRNMLLNDINDYKENKKILSSYLDRKHSFIASELIPGDDANIYAYVGYRSQAGQILNEWIGKKLGQYPDNCGVFSSASNEAPEIIRIQGRKLLEKMDLKGICEPEFKYDSRDDKYKLMEVNLRSMMWHRVGNLSGINIQYSQYLDATNQTVQLQPQNREEIIHYVYMKHEIHNLFFRKKYWGYFKHNVFGCNNRAFAIFEVRDIKPFLFDSIILIKTLIGRCLKILEIR